MDTNRENGKIMIVDDDPGVLRLLKRILEEKGYRVMAWENPFLALEQLSVEKMDLLLTDLIMPGMDGLDFLSKVREDFPRTPVILITGHPTIYSSVSATQSGAFDYLTKPFNISRIYEAVQAALTSQPTGGR